MNLIVDCWIAKDAFRQCPCKLLCQMVLLHSTFLIVSDVVSIVPFSLWMGHVYIQYRVCPCALSLFVLLNSDWFLVAISSILHWFVNCFWYFLVVDHWTLRIIICCLVLHGTSHVSFKFLTKQPSHVYGTKLSNILCIICEGLFGFTTRRTSKNLHTTRRIENPPNPKDLVCVCFFF